ncbi:hypothetical protein O181_022629 [Austropuccinia psidii MF-1]|uniref:Uncharacterized protein n=1 Tax=Austropuccinia psidii MF-1 TaxID=1389203 RepID=A0A9Q3CF56_9BASI|nr:hypothetical protein [Austropuccinia psidii MF-1]
MKVSAAIIELSTLAGAFAAPTLLGLGLGVGLGWGGGWGGWGDESGPLRYIIATNRALTTMECTMRR